MTGSTYAAAREAADLIRGVAPETAAAIDAAVADATAAGLPEVPIKVAIHYAIEKFTGEHVPGAVPVETITGEG